MHDYECECCHKHVKLPNALRCPFCNKDMTFYTDAYTRKHISKCAIHLNPYVYSERKRGRPKKEEYIAHQEEILNEDDQ